MHSWRNPRGFRNAPLTLPELLWEERPDGELRVRSEIEFPDVKRNICEYIEHWAATTPDHSFLFQRAANGEWERISYSRMWASIVATGQSLLERGLDAATPIAILTPNSIEHAILAHAAMAVGIPVCPVSPAYSMLPEARPMLKTVLGTLRPRLVFAQNVEGLPQDVRSLAELADCHWVSAAPARDATNLDDLRSTKRTDRFAAAYASTDHDTVAKILFTSGSTGNPKGVVNTHGMVCHAIAAYKACTRHDANDFVLLDWMPWHHTMGGNMQLGATAMFGGTMYIDDGRPVPGLFAKTVANLREISPTVAVSVPAYYQLLVQALENDPDLRKRFFERIRYMIHAGAKLQQSVVDGFQKIAIEETGGKIAFITAYGTTETAPGISMQTIESANAETIGHPFAGVELRLLPVDDTYEVRVRGPNVFSEYLNNGDATRAVFDEEGFYRTGDILSVVTEADGYRWMKFSGRLAENFKLAAGTWVVTGPLRTELLKHVSPLVREACVAGQDKCDVRALLWLNEAACRDAFPELAEATPQELITSEAVRTAVEVSVAQHNACNTSIAHRIAAFRLVAEPLHIGLGEITDKGSINQRRIVFLRSQLVDQLFDASGTTLQVTVMAR